MSHADDIAGYFGARPVCGRGGRLRHIGRDHWFDRGYALVRFFDGTVSLPILEMEFRSLADCNAQLPSAWKRGSVVSDLRHEM